MNNTREKLIDLMTAFYGVDPMYYGVEAHHLACNAVCCILNCSSTYHK